MCGLWIRNRVSAVADNLLLVLVSEVEAERAVLRGGVCNRKDFALCSDKQHHRLNCEMLRGYPPANCLAYVAKMSLASDGISVLC